MFDVNWDELSCDFAYDGSLRDIYVLDTAISDWQKILEAVRRIKLSPVYTVDGIAMELPTSVKEIFDARECATPLLKLYISRVCFHCHFYCEKEVEFDFRTDDVNGPEGLQVVLNFMYLLGKETLREVVVTPENDKELLILSYDFISDSLLVRPRMRRHQSPT